MMQLPARLVERYRTPQLLRLQLGVNGLEPRLMANGREQVPKLLRVSEEHHRFSRDQLQVLD